MTETTFIGANKAFLTKWLDFEGRSTRFEFNCAYWGFGFLVLAAVLAITVLSSVLLKGPLAMLGMLLAIVLLVSLVVVGVWSLVATLAITWRRLRDMGYPPLAGLLWFVPGINIGLVILLCVIPSKHDDLAAGCSD